MSLLYSRYYGRSFETALNFKKNKIFFPPELPCIVGNKTGDRYVADIVISPLEKTKLQQKQVLEYCEILENMVRECFLEREELSKNLKDIQ